MEPDLEAIERRARRAYERGRLLGGLVAASPVLGAGIAVVVLSHGEVRGVVTAVVAYAWAVYLWWRGQVLMRAMWAGATAGLGLLVATFVAHGLGAHACDLEECISNCAPKGVVGGVVSAAVLIAWTLRAPGLRQPRFWLSSGAMAVLFGSIGCTCVGYVGAFAGLGAVAAVLAPASLVLRPARLS